MQLQRLVCWLGLATFPWRAGDQLPRHLNAGPNRQPTGVDCGVCHSRAGARLAVYVVINDDLEAV